MGDVLMIMGKYKNFKTLSSESEGFCQAPFAEKLLCAIVVRYVYHYGWCTANCLLCCQMMMLENNTFYLCFEYFFSPASVYLWRKDEIF